MTPEEGTWGFQPDAPSISADGSIVVFRGRESPLLVHDRRTGETKPLPFPIRSGGQIQNQFYQRPAVSADGRYVAFTGFNVLHPSSRFNVDVRAEFPAAVGKVFGAIIDSLGATPAQIVVERAIYANSSGVTWASGTNALATRLQ